jgi:hypothetical protein
VEHQYYEYDLNEDGGQTSDFIDSSRGYGRAGTETDPEIFMPEKAVTFPPLEIQVNGNSRSPQKRNGRRSNLDG